MNPWIEGIHYYINEEGLVVMTEKFHRERGYCCGNGCKHCPYNYENVPEPKRSEILKSSPSGEKGRNHSL
jgi:hypothetical protein